jgi:chromosome segregation ATPase
LLEKSGLEAELETYKGISQKCEKEINPLKKETEGLTGTIRTVGGVLERKDQEINRLKGILGEITITLDKGGF